VLNAPRVECPCHHGMAPPRVTDGRDGLKTRKLAVTDIRQGVVHHGGWAGDKNSSPYKTNLLRNVTQSLGNGRKYEICSCSICSHSHTWTYFSV